MVNINDMVFRDTPWEELLTSCLNTSLAFCDLEPNICPYHGPRKLHWDCFSCQCRFKELCYRVFEEICEALDALNNHDHFVEEVADAMIFWNLTKFLATGQHLNPEGLIARESGSPIIDRSQPLVDLGLMTNAMKLRPWRRQFTPIDRGQFTVLLERFESTFTSWIAQNASMKSIKSAIDRKDQVNAFRLRSNY